VIFTNVVMFVSRVIHRVECTMRPAVEVTLTIDAALDLHFDFLNHTYKKIKGRAEAPPSLS